MYLRKPLWSDALKKSNPHPNPNAEADASPESDQDSPLAVVEELVGSLTKQRVYREVTLALRTGLRDARAEFSFLRVRGLRSLLKFLRSVSESDTTIELFSLSQSVRELQVVPVLFQHSLKDAEEGNVASLDHIFGVDPLKITSPSTDAEAALALRVLEGCCLLHTESTILAHQHKAIPVLMNILSTRGVLEQGACLDALISIMLDSSANQLELKNGRVAYNYNLVQQLQALLEAASPVSRRHSFVASIFRHALMVETDVDMSLKNLHLLLQDFESCHGIEEVAELIRDKQIDENLRLKCGEFLLLLIGHVNGRDKSPMATIHEDIRQLLGEKSASLIWAASQFGSTLDADQRLTALHIQARRVLESVGMY